MARPTKIPRWATTGSRVEPTELKKDAGWATQEKPPAQTMNWLHGYAGDWITWLDGDETVAAILRNGYTNAGTTWAYIGPIQGAPPFDTWRSTGVPTGNVVIPLAVSVNDIIKAWKVRCQHSVATAGMVRAQLVRSVDNGGIVNLGSAVDSAAGVGIQDIVHTLAAPHTVLANNNYYLNVFFNAAGAATRDIFHAAHTVQRGKD